MIGRDVVDDDRAAQLLAQALDARARRRGLRGGRHQGGAVLQPPAVILRMRDLDPARAEGHRLGDERLDGVDIGAVDHGVDGQRQPGRRDLAREGALLRMGAAIAGDAVGLVLAHVLDRELDVVEPGCGERRRGGPGRARSPEVMRLV